MDQIALVEERILAGQMLVEQLNREGIPVFAAAWVKESESRWYLYLVTPLVGEDRAKKPAYHHIIPVVRLLQADGIWLEPFEVKAVGPMEPVGRGIADLRQNYPGTMAIHYDGASLGNLSIDGAYIYPSAAISAA